MSDAVITIENLSKRYLLGHRSGGRGHNTLRDVITRGARNFARKAVDVFQGRQVVQGDEVEEFWALKNVSFAIQQGEVLGIIGRNGAGKSTLLKILSRVTEPTEGRVLVRGRVSSLLEVGTGFHPELTGRENIFLNGAILGMRQREIHKKFDEIVSFAGVERFIDTPVKRYSSGMYVRLAFAVAAHLEPEILIIDEVLAVGDAEFQKKCLGKIDEVSRRDGRTVLFVSHNLGAITSLCPNVIWLEHGSICEQGPTRPIIDRYLAHKISKDTIVLLTQFSRPPDWDDRLRLETLEWISGLPLRHGESVRARIRFRTRVPLAQVSIGIGFSTFDGRRLLTYETDFQDGLRPSINRPGVHSVDVTIDSLPLPPDLYDLDLGSKSGDSHQLDYLPSAIGLEIIPGLNTPGYIVNKDAGVRLASEWKWDLECETTSTFAPLSSLTVADCSTGRRASRDT
jgi:lipopolysaccharide transport system ATP-binding protein